MGVAFAQHLADHGDRIALVAADGATVSYRDLAAAVDAETATLGPTRRLVFWDAQATPEAIVTYLAALAAGHPVLPIATGKDQDRARLAEIYGRAPVLHADLRLLLSTSGSTGASKLVRLSAGNLASNAAAIAHYLGLTPDDRAALILPLHYSYGLSVLHAHLHIGASIDLGLPGILAPHFQERLQESRATNLAGVPYSFDLLEQIGFRERDFPDLRLMTVAGGRLAPDLVKRYAGHLQRRGGRFCVMYGQTEATARIAYLPPDAAFAHADCIGAAIPGGALSLWGEDGAEITGAGISGELVYRGPNVMMGYAETAADLARGADLAELRTGDLAERNAAGFYRITGRLSRFSKIAGQRIGHDALEKRFEALGVALAVTGNDDGLQIAFAGGGDKDALRAEIAAACGLNAAFIRLRAVPHLPRNANGKIDYAALKAIFDDAPAAAPSSVAEAFAETFAPRIVRPGDSFVSLGGDSLSFVQLSLALEHSLPTLPRDWEKRSVAALTALLPAPQPPASQPAASRYPAFWRSWVADWRPLDANLFMRALAILFIVLHHATMWEIAGGAATLLMLAGYNVARFQGAKLMAGQSGDFLWAVLRPLPLYYAVLLIYCAYTGLYPWQSLLLLGNLGIDGYSTMPTPLVAYWFIEAYVQMMLLIAGLFLWPALRRRVIADPFRAGLAFVALAIALRVVQPMLWDAGDMKAFVTQRVLYLAGLGWCIYFADTRMKRLVMTALIVTLLLALPYLEGAKAGILWVRAAVLIGSAVTLLWWANIALPRRLAGMLAAVAAASYSIYLFHNVPFFVWLEKAGLPRVLDDSLHFTLGLGLGFVVHHLVQNLTRTLRQSSLAQLLWRHANQRRLQPGE